MAYPAVQELDALLQSLQTLKPPGVNKPKVDTATKICMELQNIPIEPHFVDSLVNAFRKSPVSHKLGVLYIIDSIMRQWVVTGAAHAGGVRRMTDSMPALMNDYISVVPEAQKDRLFKLLDIWTSSKTFPIGMLAEFRNRLANPHTNTAQQQPPAQLPVDPASLLAALNAPPPRPTQQSSAAHQPPAIANNAVLAALQNLAPPPVSNAQVTGNVPLSFPQNNAPVNFPPQPSPVVPQQTSVASQLPFNAPPQQANNLNALAALLPNAQAGVQDPNALLNQLQLLQSLNQSLGPDGLRTILQALGAQQQGAPNQALAPAYPPAPVVAPPPNVNQYPGQNGQLYGRDDAGTGARERSRSPDWNRRRYSPPNRRDSPTYGNYDPHKNDDSRGQDDRGRRGNRRGGGASAGGASGGFRNDYRQRSPQPSTRDSPVPRNNAPKPVGYDSKLQDGRIKVLSRTLFVGGVKTSETELKSFFCQFGGVQSCIVNHEKRHAFLKLISHQDAMATRQSVWNLPESEYRGLFERVNWAVGFGPTHCADYNIGVSVIPMDLLTDADRKWLLTAEYGGTGGKQIQTGMVVEEPDIEIGTGPSSKAIHRRGGGHQSGRASNNMGRRGAGGVSSPDQSGRNQNRGYNRPEAPVVPEPNTIGPPPAVPTFGAPIPGFPFNIR